ncbi:MAG: class I SAM-dependent methyltransferase [Bacteroidota bacterium]
MEHKSVRWCLAQWLEIRWWQNYLAKQNPAAYRAQKIAYWQRLLNTLDVQIAPNERLLDAGCGPAGIFLLFDDQPTVAIDPLLDQYTAQLPHFQPHSHPNVQFLSQPLEALQTKQPFDTIFCLNAINHVNDWTLGLARLTQAARPGTRLVLGVDVHKYALLKAIFRTLPGDVLHPHQHDRTDYRIALEELGWSIEREHTWKRGRIFDYWLVVATQMRNQWSTAL